MLPLVAWPALNRARTGAALSSLAPLRGAACSLAALGPKKPLERALRAPAGAALVITALVRWATAEACIAARVTWEGSGGT